MFRKYRFTFVLTATVFAVIAVPQTLADLTAENAGGPQLPATGVGTVDLLAYAANDYFGWVNSDFGGGVMLPDDEISVPIHWPSGRSAPSWWLPRLHKPAIGFRGQEYPGEPPYPSPYDWWVWSGEGGERGEAYCSTEDWGTRLNVLSRGSSRREGAAEAVHSFPVNAGIYDYGWVTNINIYMDDYTESGCSGMSAWAMDSRFSEPLWLLVVLGRYPVKTADDLWIGFSSNPVLGLDDSAVAQMLRDAFRFEEGTFTTWEGIDIEHRCYSASVQDYSLFHTTYQVDVPIIYSEGLNTASVPEPATVALFGLGALVLLRNRRFF